MDIVDRMMAERDAARLITEGYAKMLGAAEAEIERLRAALTGIKRAGKARMASYGDEHSYYYFTAHAALEQNKPETRISEQASEQPPSATEDEMVRRLKWLQGNKK